MAEVPATPIMVSPRTPCNNEYSVVEEGRVGASHTRVIDVIDYQTKVITPPSKEESRTNMVSFSAKTHKVGFLSMIQTHG